MEPLDPDRSLTPASDAVDRVHRSIVIIGISNAALFLILIAIVVIGWIRFAQVNNSLCDLRHEREQSVAAQERFLKAHPNGFGDVTRADLEAGVALQQGTIDALSGLHCN